MTYNSVDIVGKGDHDFDPKQGQAMLTGKRVMITGAGAGIGLAVARQMGQAGAHLFLVDVDPQAVARAVSDLQDFDTPVTGIAASVASATDVGSAFDAIDAAYGGIDILINNAGITGNCHAADLDLATWERVIGVNQTGTFLCAQAAGVRMRKQQSGVIINLSSIYGLVAAPNRLAYSATKAAVIMMTKALAVEWAADNIRVNCVAPGYVETPGTAALANDGIIDLDALRRRTPQKRLAQPDDVARAIVALCDDGLFHVTGQVLAVDGGWSAYGYL